MGRPVPLGPVVSLCLKGGHLQLDLMGGPGRATLQFTITFDGGALGNPGVGYGSYAIARTGGEPVISRLEFSQNGEVVTNNQAEYRTLIAALEELVELLGPDASKASVSIHGDSKLVIEQVAGRWKVKNAELAPLRKRASELMSAFAEARLVWHPRAKSVDTLGH